MSANLPSTSAEEAARELEGLDRARKWRLILGPRAEQQLGVGLEAGSGQGGVGQHLVALDAALGAIYDAPDEGDGPRGAGLGKSAPRVARWLGDVRKYFPREVVAVVQRDAVERKGLEQLLFEPELMAGVEPSVELAATLLTLKGLVPEAARDSARALVRKVAEDIARRLQTGLERSVRGALRRTRHAALPRLANLDVKRTLRHNLKNWDARRKQLIVDRTFFFARQQRQFAWRVIVCLDESGSMAPSVVYGAVVASILASLPALKTHLVAFDTEVVDLTEQCHDPVDVLFGVQLGGGTDINRAVGYCQELVTEPRKTLFVLVSDLAEGGNGAELLQRLESMARSGVRCVALLALNDGGAPSYDHAMAQRVRALEIPVFACTPEKLPEVLEAALRGEDLARFDRKAR